MKHLRVNRPEPTGPELRPSTSHSDCPRRGPAWPPFAPGGLPGSPPALGPLPPSEALIVASSPAPSVRTSPGPAGLSSPSLAGAGSAAPSSGVPGLVPQPMSRRIARLSTSFSRTDRDHHRAWDSERRPVRISRLRRPRLLRHRLHIAKQRQIRPAARWQPLGRPRSMPAAGRQEDVVVRPIRDASRPRCRARSQSRPSGRTHVCCTVACDSTGS